MSEKALLEWSMGVHIVGTPIWCDAVREREVTFVSSVAPLTWPRRGSRQARVLCTEETARALRALHRLPSQEVLVTPFGRPLYLGKLRLELLPSGRHPGAAQLLVEVKGKRVLYSVGVDPNAAETQVRSCDALVLAPTTAHLRSADLLTWVRENERGVVLASLYGDLLRVATVLQRHQIPLLAPRRVGQLLSAVATKAWRGRLGPGEILLWPKEQAKPKLSAPRFEVDGASDPTALLEFARSTGAEEIFLTEKLDPGWVAPFAAAKMRVQTIAPPHQIPLLR